MIKSKEILNKLTEASNKIIWKTAKSGGYYEATTKKYYLKVYPKDGSWISVVLDSENHFQRVASKSFESGFAANPVSDAKKFCELYVSQH